MWIPNECLGTGDLIQPLLYATHTVSYRTLIAAQLINKCNIQPHYKKTKRLLLCLVLITVQHSHDHDRH
jgi:hypothetical protein